MKGKQLSNQTLTITDQQLQAKVESARVLATALLNNRKAVNTQVIIEHDFKQCCVRKICTSLFEFMGLLDLEHHTLQYRIPLYQM